MSTKYPGGILSKTAPVPTGPYANSEAPGVWTLEQQAYWVEQGNWPTAGNVNPDAFIENLFSTYLYTGASGAQSINNGIDLAGEGGLLWLKDRTNAGTYHYLEDSARGAAYSLSTNTTGAQQYYPNYVTSFNSNGFTIGAGQDNAGAAIASWTFRKQPKFFDVVTFTQSGTSGWQTVNHSLGSVPGCIIFKNASTTASWPVYHRYDATKKLLLDSTSGAITETIVQNITSTSFEVSISNIGNNNGDTFVAYLFAHDSGGFGLTGTDNVISCGSFANGNSSVTLGWEPQWILAKPTGGADGVGWSIVDSMRGLNYSNDPYLMAQSSSAELTNGGAFMQPTATGFNVSSLSGTGPFIYIAIRRGPMKVPTDGTKVFKPVTYTGNSSTQTLSGFGFPPDAVLLKNRSSTASTGSYFVDKLRGGDALLNTPTTSAELVGFGTTTFNQDGISLPSLANINGSGTTYIDWAFRRAPGFFDEVCYTGTGGYVSRNHNLAAVPEMMIVKARSASGYNWAVYHSSLGFESYMRLNTAGTPSTTGDFWYLTPTATQFSTGGYADIDDTGITYVNYLFASAPGVSKVGSYTGTGTTQVIDCGFTGGARFVLIKRTNGFGGDWFVWDSARGIVAGNDPYLLLNSTAAEVTGTDYVDTSATGFEISSTAPAAINASGGTFIFLAIA